ncbi:MAG: CBS domain-containing protein [Planctomycetes bacterium]|nr:CBS domain-containing protein [Planctomycetota bacterium]
MRAAEIMTKEVEIVSPNQTANEAWNRMKLKGFHHLVVVERGIVIGLLSDRDLGGKYGDSLRAGKSVGSVMTPYAVTVTPETPVKRIANVMRGHSIGCVPVMDGDRLAGIVTTTDLLQLIGRGVERPISSTQRRTLHARGRAAQPQIRNVGRNR